MVTRNRCILAMALCALACSMAICHAQPSDEAKRLRLIPFPKNIEILDGRLRIGSRMAISVSDHPAARQAASDLQRELEQIAGTRCEVRVLPVNSSHDWTLVLSRPGTDIQGVTASMSVLPSQPESYRLAVVPGFAAVRAREHRGLVWGIQTLRQLVRANMQDGTIACMTIRDWPSLTYRGFQNDLTRAISSKLDTLEHQVEMAALLKYNFWTYYMEHQFAFTKHPDIGPKDGQLTPQELRALVDHAVNHGVEIAGCQQSFGHFENILRLPGYAHLAESEAALDPTNEESYKLLDDLYSDVAPVVNSVLFNVCSDETWSLGTGKAKELVAEMGVGAVYTMHMRRVHDIITGKYGKRMMMWGDIIFNHPEHMHDIPSDTIMITWNYGPSPSFDSVIVPFAKAEHDFFVAPAVMNWFRIMPVFDDAVINIANFVRDGHRHGALGMLLTSWNDDTSTFFGYNWHGVAWGAECSWNASTTPADDFNRRVGAVLFGERGDHFGKAIELLGRTHSVEGFHAMSTPRFWQQDNGELGVSIEVERKHNRQLLSLVKPALEHLHAAKRDARFNEHLLDYFIFAAERVGHLATRMDRLLDAAQAYEEAARAVSAAGDPYPYLRQSAELLAQVRDEIIGFRDRCEALWKQEARQYGMDWNLNAFSALARHYDNLIAGIERAERSLRQTGQLPPAGEVGLNVVEKGIRNARPTAVVEEALSPEVAWAAAGFGKRIGISVGGAGQARMDQPIEVALPVGVASDGPVMLMELDGSGAQRPLACQVDVLRGTPRLAFLMPGDLSGEGIRSFLLYYDGPAGPARPAGISTVSLEEAGAGKLWIQNDAQRMLFSPEGAHIHRWEIAALDGLDITAPGETEWRGFADANDEPRFAAQAVEVIADGPALVRLQCTNNAGVVKTISVWAGVPWAEVTFDREVGVLRCYDNESAMGPHSPTPATYLFSNGEAGTLESRLYRRDVHWSAKFAADGPLLALMAPTAKGTHIVNTGGHDGGIAAEARTAHFVIYGGISPNSPTETLDRTRAALDYARPPAVHLHAEQSR